MNVLSFDIEEWALAEVGGYATPKLLSQYDTFLNNILDLLDEKGLKATFFCTGQMAQLYPNIVKLIQSRGHEIGCHSHLHTWMNSISEEEARKDTHSAVGYLEQCLGEKVISYRAPAFSIGENNKWMFEILTGEGLSIDASVFPASRDFGGFPSFNVQEPCLIEYKGVVIKEFPINMTEIAGRKIAYTGGGYFRFFPLAFVRRRLLQSEYSMCYFHINDILPVPEPLLSKDEHEAYYKEPGTIKNRYVRYIKSNIGKKNAWDKLSKLISSIAFVNICEFNKSINWGESPKVVL